MIGTIRKHQTWLWVFIIIVVSISMVVFFSNNATLFGPKAPRGEFGSMNGVPFNQNEYFDALKEIKITYIVRTGHPPGSDDAASRRLESDTVSRLFLIHKLKEMDIDPSEKAIGVMMEEQIRDYPLGKFEDEFLRPSGLTIADYRRFLKHEVGIRQLFAAAAASARLVTPQEAEALYRKEHQESQVEVAGFWATNYLDKVAITNGAIAAFYSNRMAFYRIPPKTVISYVAFEPSNFLAEAEAESKNYTNLNEIVSRRYFERGTNEWTDASGKVLNETEARKKILDDIQLGFGLTAARRAAAEFGTRLMNQPDPNKVENLVRLAAEQKLTLKATAPFDATSGLDEFKHEDEGIEREAESFVEALRKRALALTPDRPILFNSIAGRHGIYLIAFKEKLPSQLPTLDKIQDKVTADYKQVLALNIAREAGRAFHTNLTNGLALKKPFAEICAAQKVNPVELPLFSPGTRSLTNLDSRISLQQLQGVVPDLAVGQASGFIPTQEGGYIAYMKSRPPIDEAKMKADLPQFTGNLRQYRHGEAFQSWFRKQADLSKLSLPPRNEPTVGAQNAQN